MSKTLKRSILLIVILLGVLFLSGTMVYATEVAEVNSTDDITGIEYLKEAFKGENVSFNEKTITLTGDVEKELILNFDEDDYILDLNGFKFTPGEIYINSGSLTINDSKGNGEIDTTSDWISVEEGAKLIINNGKIDYLVNNGTIIVNKGSIGIINNDGTMTINDGTFEVFWQRGTAKINGGTFKTCTIDLDRSSTVIEGNVKFTNDGSDKPLIINSSSSIDGTVINQVLGEGYIAASFGYGTNSQSFFDEELQETLYLYEVNYESTTIIKDETDKIFNKIAPNGVWTINSFVPDNGDNAWFLLTAIADEIEIPEGYYIEANCGHDENFNPKSANLSIYTDEDIYLAEKQVKVVYQEPDAEILPQLNSIIDKIDKYSKKNHSEETGFRLEDLYLINYLNSLSKGKDIDGSVAINFSKDLIELTNGSNISYKIDSRLGSGHPSELMHYEGGQVIVYFDKKPVGTTIAGLTINNTIYVPNETQNTDKAKIDAALKRIEEYLGTTKGISIKVGGTFESLEEGWNEYGFIDEKTCGANYYNITINGNTYRFAICKKDVNKLETPKYIGSDVISNVFITSDSTKIPLDTAITVKPVTSDKIEKALGTSKYAAYEISLYSNAKQVKITELENGKFVVSIPVPKILEGKEITVYYITSTGEKEEHDATVKDGIASFETDHFSIYALAEKVDSATRPLDEEPKAGDTSLINYAIFIAVISIFGIAIIKK